MPFHGVFRALQECLVARVILHRARIRRCRSLGRVPLRQGRRGSGGLTAAAAQLGINHSTAFRRLTALEAGLGVRLFDRLRTGYVPTPCGQAMIEAATRIEADVTRFERAAAGRGDRLRRAAGDRAGRPRRGPADADPGGLRGPLPRHPDRSDPLRGGAQPIAPRRRRRDPGEPGSERETLWDAGSPASLGGSTAWPTAPTAISPPKTGSAPIRASQGARSRGSWRRGCRPTGSGCGSTR